MINENEPNILEANSLITFDTNELSNKVLDDTLDGVGLSNGEFVLTNAINTTDLLDDPSVFGGFPGNAISRLVIFGGAIELASKLVLLGV